MSMENRVNRLESMASKRCSKDATQMTDEELEQIIREGHDIEGPITDDVLLKIKGGEIPPRNAEGEQNIEEVSQVSIEKRIGKLEQIKGGHVCPTCGCSKGDPTCFEINERKEPLERKPAPTETCPDCGRLIKFTLEFGQDIIEQER